MITYQVQRMAEVIDEIKPLLGAHWQEIAMYKDKVALDPDYERYQAMDDIGMLHIVTARDEGRLIGYCITFVIAHIHYRNCIMGMNDVIFISPEYRRGSLGIRMMQFAERELKAAGVDVMTFHVKLDHDFGPVLDRNGFKAIEKVYSKYIGGGE